MDSNPNSLHREHITSHICTTRCISWTAIFVGAIVAISLSFILNLLGIAIGLSAFPATLDGQSAFAIGGFVGLVIFAIISMFPAGWIAGYLGRSHCLRRKMGELYGLGTWGVALIMGIVLASYAGQFMMQSNYLVSRNAALVRLSDSVNKPITVTQNPNTQNPAAVTKDKDVTQAAGVATFVSFFVFFIGLITCCFGGRLGMSYHRKMIMNEMHCPVCADDRVRR